MKTSERINYIKSWILDYCKSMPNEAETLVVGISGGIDSSVTSTICALTGKKTIVLSMPIKQMKEQHSLSLKHQQWLKMKFKNVEGHLIDLDNVFNVFLENPDEYLFTDFSMAEQNNYWQYWSYPSWPSHLDHIIISNELFNDYEKTTSTCNTILVDETLFTGWENYDEYISDHRPVGISLDISQ